MISLSYLQNVCDVIQLSYTEIFVLLSLLVITIFRREISCNRCYTTDGSNVTPSMRRITYSAIETSTNETTTTTTNSVNSRPPLISRRIREEMTSSLSSIAAQGDDEQQIGSILDGVERMNAKISILASIVAYLLVTPFSVLRYEVPELLRKLLKSNDSHLLEDVLDSAGNFCSGQPFFTFCGTCKRMPSSIIVPNSGSNQTIMIDENVFVTKLPIETTIHILSFLPSRDIVSSFACVSKGCYNLVNDIDDTNDVVVPNDSSMMHCVHSTPNHAATVLLWKTLFERDYSWTVDVWNIGRAARNRSLQNYIDPISESKPTMEVLYCKDFYFRFSLCYVNYLLAGQNTSDSCLVGLGGHIFDLTSFLVKHPGSIDTVLVHAGKDATSSFERMSHTSRARRIARQQLCVVVNSLLLNSSDDNHDRCDTFHSSYTGSGLRPTFNLVNRSRNDDGSLNDVANSFTVSNNYPAVINELLLDNIFPPRNRLTTQQTNNLPSVKKIRDEYYQEEANVISFASRQLGPYALGEDVNVYYDPFISKWKAWYICSETFQNKFVDFE